MAIFKSYQHAVRAGYGPVMTPPDEPDYPERDDVPEKYWQLECMECGTIGWEDAELAHNHAVYGPSYVCNHCGSVAHDEELWDEELWIKELKEQA